MNILHISDIHFGPYHWLGDDNQLLKRLNEYQADIVFNTGDMTSDSLEDEYQRTQDFLSKINCENIVSIIGNHDKYSLRSHEMFREYIYDGKFIEPKDPAKVEKREIFIKQSTATLGNYFTDINYLRQFEFDGKKILVVCVDTPVFQSDYGFIEEQILEALSDEISELSYDHALLLSHHSVLSTDGDPLINSMRLKSFILDHGIEASFCGHTHELDISTVSDLLHGRSFRQFMCGTTSSVNLPREQNTFCSYTNFGTPDEKITITRIILNNNGLEFHETDLKGH